MNSIDILCKAYFYRSNFNFLLSSKEAPPEIMKKITEIIKLSEEVYRKLVLLGKEFNLEISVLTGYSTFAGKELKVNLMAIGEELNDIELILRPIFIEMGALGLERPLINIFAFYHPPVRIIVDDKDGWILPQGITLKDLIKAKEENRIHINIFDINLDLIRQIVKAFIRLSLWENAIAVPSEKAVEGYSEKIIRSLSKREQNQLLIGFNEIIDGLIRKLRKLDSKVKKQFGELINEVNDLLSNINL